MQYEQMPSGDLSGAPRKTNKQKMKPLELQGQKEQATEAVRTRVSAKGATTRASRSRKQEKNGGGDNDPEQSEVMSTRSSVRFGPAGAAAGDAWRDLCNTR